MCLRLLRLAAAADAAPAVASGWLRLLLMRLRLLQLVAAYVRRVQDVAVAEAPDAGGVGFRDRSEGRGTGRPPITLRPWSLVAATIQHKLN